MKIFFILMFMTCAKMAISQSCPIEFLRQVVAYYVYVEEWGKADSLMAEHPQDIVRRRCFPGDVVKTYVRKRPDLLDETLCFYYSQGFEPSMMNYWASKEVIENQDFRKCKRQNRRITKTLHRLVVIDQYIRGNEVKMLSDSQIYALDSMNLFQFYDLIENRLDEINLSHYRDVHIFFRHAQLRDLQRLRKNGVMDRLIDRGLYNRWDELSALAYCEEKDWIPLTPSEVLKIKNEVNELNEGRLKRGVLPIQFDRHVLKMRHLRRPQNERDHQMLREFDEFINSLPNQLIIQPGKPPSHQHKDE